MAQDGHQANQGAAAGNGHGAAPASPCESTNLGTIWTLAPAEVDVVDHGEEGDGSGGKDSTIDAVMAADVTEGKVDKDKRKAAASEQATRQVITGRERRAQMKKMYDDLRSLVPNLDKKVRLSLLSDNHERICRSWRRFV